jgi:hypothetical protein
MLAIVPNSLAEDQEKQREQVKKDLLLPECSWSTMQKAEYDQCQKQRSTMKAMTPEERAKYLDATTGQGVVTTDDSGDLLRNKAISNRAGGGRRR